MGLLQQGRWVDRWYDTQSSGGSSFARIVVSETGLRPMVSGV